jgi:hypothetical protein
MGGSTRPRRPSLAQTDGPPGGLPPNTCAPSSATAMLLANPGRSTATAAPSRFAAPMAATSGPTWWPMATLGPSSDIAATRSRKNTKRRRCGREYTVTHASPRGSGAPRTAQRARVSSAKFMRGVRSERVARRLPRAGRREDRHPLLVGRPRTRLDRPGDVVSVGLGSAGHDGVNVGPLVLPGGLL